MQLSIEKYLKNLGGERYQVVGTDTVAKIENGRLVIETAMDDSTDRAEVVTEEYSFENADGDWVKLTVADGKLTARVLTDNENPY